MILTHIDNLIHESSVISREESAKNRLETIKTLNKFTLTPTIVGAIMGGSIGKTASALDPSPNDFPIQGYMLGAAAGAILGNLGALALLKYFNVKITDVVKPQHFGKYRKECESFIQDIFSLYYPILSDATNISYKAEIYNLYKEYMTCMESNKKITLNVRKCYIYLVDQLLHDLQLYMSKAFLPEYEKVIKYNFIPRFHELKIKLLENET